MIEQLLAKLDMLIALHRKNEDMWVDFFESGREKILKDVAFGCEYLIMAWHGIGGYDDERIFDNEEDEALRRALHPQIYNMATEIKNDRNKAA
ncbi:MAG TPA: hypothetical protein VFS88_07610 [Micavibrio sp.]|nr:hypothetical protein [Micavibrio sp.]